MFEGFVWNDCNFVFLLTFQLLCRAVRQAKKVEVVHRLSSWKHVTFKGSQVFKCCMRAQTSKSRSLGNSKTAFVKSFISALAADVLSQSGKNRPVWSVKCWKPARASQRRRTQEPEGGEERRMGAVISGLASVFWFPTMFLLDWDETSEGGRDRKELPDRGTDK